MKRLYAARAALALLALSAAPACWASGFAHSLQNTLMHAVVYGFVFKVMHHLSLAGAGVLALAVVGVVWWLQRKR